MNLTEKILRSVDALPPFSGVMERVIQLVNDPEASIQDIVDVIQFDQSITASILKICNSSYFGLRRKVHSLREALVIIGFDQLMEIILGKQSSSLLSQRCEGYDLGAGELWRHSVGCALLSRILAKRMNHEPSFDRFTAALVHDIGKVILGQYVRDYLDEIKKLIQKERLIFTEAEREVLGIDHAELGAIMTEQWNFPGDIVHAIRYHHTPALTPSYHNLVQAVYLCDLVSVLAGVGGGADAMSYSDCREVLNQYNLKQEDIEVAIVQLNDRFNLVQEVVSGCTDILESGTVADAKDSAV